MGTTIVYWAYIGVILEGWKRKWKNRVEGLLGFREGLGRV